MHTLQEMLPCQRPTAAADNSGKQETAGPECRINAQPFHAVSICLFNNEQNRARNYIIIMDNLRFSWEYQKAQSNLRKHGVSFNEATTAFADSLGFEFFDPDHSDSEDRFLFIGFTSFLRLVIVSYCYRQKDNVIRIISARKATKKETSYYRSKHT